MISVITLFWLLFTRHQPSAVVLIHGHPAACAFTVSYTGQATEHCTPIHH